MTFSANADPRNYQLIRGLSLLASVDLRISTSCVN